MVRTFSRRRWLTVPLGVAGALALVVAARWLNATKRGGQEPAEPFRIAGVLQQASGAELWASDASADAITAGGDDPDIFLPLRVLFRIGLLGYPATRVDRRFKDGDTIRVGPIALTAHITGGHTRGCTSGYRAHIDKAEAEFRQGVVH